jgi:phosphatidylserine synthase
MPQLSEANFLEKNGSIFGGLVSAIYVIFGGYLSWSVYNSKIDKKYIGMPIFLGIVFLIANIYIIAKQKETDESKKREANVVYFHISFIPLYLLGLALLIFIAKESPILSFMMLR